MISGTPESFKLDAQLDRDTIAVGDLALSHVLLVEDSNYRWLILVPRRPAVTELIDLSAADRAVLMEEIAIVSRVLRDVAGCDKLNVAALGNVVAQLHVHIIARRKADPAWPKPVWGVVPARPYAPDTRAALLKSLREQLKIAPP
ncbi:MAG: HIT domain-containing protein [Pseudolabrys sp.]|nr:HIT domain-containing protein [Pseudolabrys sp.]